VRGHRDRLARLDVLPVDRPDRHAALGQPTHQPVALPLLPHQPGTIRGDLGTDSQEQSRAENRLIENLIHSSDDAATVCRDFGTWFGANRYQLLTPSPAPGAAPNPMEDMP
jgi:hypothetical protein